MKDTKITLDILAEEAVTKRNHAYSRRGIKTKPMTVNTDTCTVAIGDSKTVLPTVPALIRYLEIEIAKSEMLEESVRTKRFNAREYGKLKLEQVECTKDFVYDETEEEVGFDIDDVPGVQFELDDSTDDSGQYTLGDSTEVNEILDENVSYWTEEELTDYLSGVPEDERRTAISTIRNAGAPEDILQKAIRNSRK